MLISKPKHIANIADIAIDSSKHVVIDIDGVICQSHHGDYANADPLKYGVSQVNKLVEQGYYVILFTARYGDRELGCLPRQYQRGFKELVDWLEKQGVMYHEVRLGKPPAILYIDDKAARVTGDDHAGWEQVNIGLEDAIRKDKYGQ